MSPVARSVAIWGGCATRDAFAVPERRAELEQRLPLLYYAARSSWISQDSRPWAPPPGDLCGLSGFAARVVREDLDKQIVPRLIAHRPDIVVFDLITERRPLFRFGRTWVTGSEYLDRTPLGKRAAACADKVSHLPQPRRARLFARATRRLARQLCQGLPRTIFVLNEAPYVTRIAGGTVLPEPQAGWARELQTLQQPMFDTLAEAFGDRMVRLVPPRGVCLADPDHRWGLTSYHLVTAYRHWLLDQLLALEQPRPPTGRSSTTNRPDAARWWRREARPAPAAAEAPDRRSARPAAAAPALVDLSQAVPRSSAEDRAGPDGEPVAGPLPQHGGSGDELTVTPPPVDGSRML